MRIIVISSILSALLATGIHAQTVNVYSDSSCQNQVGTYSCGDYFNKCTELPDGGILSYQVTSAGDNCPPCAGDCVFNTFEFFTSSGCGGQSEVGGFGSAGCSDDNGCLTTLNADGTPGPAATYFQCAEDFSCIGDC